MLEIWRLPLFLLFPFSIWCSIGIMFVRPLIFSLWTYFDRRYFWEESNRGVSLVCLTREHPSALTQVPSSRTICLFTSHAKFYIWWMGGGSFVVFVSCEFPQWNASLWLVFFVCLHLPTLGMIETLAKFEFEIPWDPIKLTWCDGKQLNRSHDRFTVYWWFMSDAIREQMFFKMSIYSIWLGVHQALKLNTTRHLAFTRF